MRRVIAFVSLFGAALFGCASAPEQSSGKDPPAAAEQGLAGGCRMVCPKCPANKICPTIACYEDCNGKPRECVQTALCIQGYAWDSKSCQCVPSKPAPGACATDADCRTFADYCTGCNCLALSSNQADPTCSGPGVRCFADPCLGKAAACVSGSCSLQ